MQVRTSRSHPLRIDWLHAPHKHSLGLTFAPGKHADSLEGPRWERDLDTDLDVIQDAGVALLVTLMESPELERCAIKTLPEKLQARGMNWLHCPIPDGGIPRLRHALDATLDRIDECIDAGARVVIHCLGGLGRTGTVAGCYLVRRGFTPAAALRLLVETRGSSRCPENDSQRDYVRIYR